MSIPKDQIPSLSRSIANGDDDAALFLENIWHAARLADNIVDGDSPDLARDMFNLLNRAFVSNANNPFFLRHQETLSVAIMTALGMWLKSEQWRHEDDRKTRMFAFIYREGVDHIASVVSGLTSGPSGVVQAMENMYEISHRHDGESFEDWDAERFQK